METAKMTYDDINTYQVFIKTMVSKSIISEEQKKYLFIDIPNHVYSLSNAKSVANLYLATYNII